MEGVLRPDCERDRFDTGTLSPHPASADAQPSDRRAQLAPWRGRPGERSVPEPMSLIGVVARGAEDPVGIVNSLVRCSSLRSATVSLLWRRGRRGSCATYSGVAPVLSGCTDLDSGLGVMSLFRPSQIFGVWLAPPCLPAPPLLPARLRPAPLFRRERLPRRLPPLNWTLPCGVALMAPGCPARSLRRPPSPTKQPPGPPSVFQPPRNGATARNRLLVRSQSSSGRWATDCTPDDFAWFGFENARLIHGLHCMGCQDGKALHSEWSQQECVLWLLLWRCPPRSPRGLAPPTDNSQGPAAAGNARRRQRRGRAPRAARRRQTPRAVGSGVWLPPTSPAFAPAAHARAARRELGHDAGGARPALPAAALARRRTAHARRLPKQ